MVALRSRWIRASGPSPVSITPQGRFSPRYPFTPLCRSPALSLKPPDLCLGVQEEDAGGLGRSLTPSLHGLPGRAGVNIPWERGQKVAFKRENRSSP